MVAASQAAFHPDLDRTGDQLKKEFNKLARTRVPNGNPNIPPMIRKVKEIRELIIDKSKGVTGSEEEIFPQTTSRMTMMKYEWRNTRG